MGQGSDTAMAQIAAEVLGVTTESVKVVHSDTDVTPYDMATLGSRSLFHMGNAVKLAAEDTVQKINLLRKETQAAPDATLKDMFRKKYGMQAGNVLGQASFVPTYTSPDADGLTDNATPFWMVGATGVEIDVDTETGRVTITRLIN